ncbi:MAG: CPBP family intramembrane metalloprotease [Saprospiraceae bacterium]|nr:CPBP family intramembrane metalloprotease [Saprospiraceae bacterium]
MTITNNQAYAHPLTIGLLIVTSYATLAIFILWRLFNRVIDTYKPEHISFKNGTFILQPDDRSVSIFELYSLNDFVYHFFIPIAVISIYALIKKWDIKMFFGFSSLVKLKNWVYFLIAVVAIIGINLMLPPPDAEAAKLFERISQGQTLFHLILIIGVLIPIIEEVIFRRLFYDLLNFSVPVASPWIGIIVSAIIFGALHYQYQAAAMIATLIVSLILSYGRYYTKGIVFPILIHVIINTLGCIMIA